MLARQPVFTAAFAGPRVGVRHRPAVGSSDPQRWLLLLRWLLVNLSGLGILGAAWQQGWIATVLAGDSTRLVLLIAAVFAFGLVRSGVLALRLARELDAAREPRPASGSCSARFLDGLERAGTTGRTSLEAALKLELVAAIAPVRHIASSLVLLGLVGTVLGFVLALSGVDADAAADLSRVAPMVSRLIEGLGVALYTTLVGAVLNIWLMADYRLLEAGASALAARLLERGARTAPAVR